MHVNKQSIILEITAKLADILKDGATMSFKVEE
jgi:hypothetical protein